MSEQITCKCSSSSFHIISQKSGLFMTCCTDCGKEAEIGPAPTNMRVSEYGANTVGMMPTTFAEAAAMETLCPTYSDERDGVKYGKAFEGDLIFADVLKRFDDPQIAWSNFITRHNAMGMYPPACDCQGCIEKTRVFFTLAFLYQKENP